MATDGSGLVGESIDAVLSSAAGSGTDASSGDSRFLLMSASSANSGAPARRSSSRMPSPSRTVISHSVTPWNSYMAFAFAKVNWCSTSLASSILARSRSASSWLQLTSTVSFVRPQPVEKLEPSDDVESSNASIELSTNSPSEPEPSPSGAPSYGRHQWRGSAGGYAKSRRRTSPCRDCALARRSAAVGGPSAGVSGGAASAGPASSPSAIRGMRGRGRGARSKVDRAPPPR
ncbi:hypothetical protein DFJ74DRAFT_688768 [Hyaloraphidium curvatum]|nr:hypothetical protein DFJ74DRAFT_688768 [Hyaloraphidium curvatum]